MLADRTRSVDSACNTRMHAHGLMRSEQRAIARLGIDMRLPRSLRCRRRRTRIGELRLWRFLLHLLACLSVCNLISYVYSLRLWMLCMTCVTILTHVYVRNHFDSVCSFCMLCN